MYSASRKSTGYGAHVQAAAKPAHASITEESFDHYFFFGDSLRQHIVPQLHLDLSQFSINSLCLQRCENTNLCHLFGSCYATTMSIVYHIVGYSDGAEIGFVAATGYHKA